eukprot:GHVH01002208.1.p1 GENE.GHVH01002208.1~~GHVH01002208.1.p1  ORF type:complete len:619 (-),score=69.32 GHVH01002208.1:4354-6210(-)
MSSPQWDYRSRPFAEHRSLPQAGGHQANVGIMSSMNRNDYPPSVAPHPTSQVPLHDMILPDMHPVQMVGAINAMHHRPPHPQMAQPPHGMRLQHHVQQYQLPPLNGAIYLPQFSHHLIATTPPSAMQMMPRPHQQYVHLQQQPSSMNARSREYYQRTPQATDLSCQTPHTADFIRYSVESTRKPRHTVNKSDGSQRLSEVSADQKTSTEAADAALTFDPPPDIKSTEEWRVYQRSLEEFNHKRNSTATATLQSVVESFMNPQIDNPMVVYLSEQIVKEMDMVNYYNRYSKVLCLQVLKRTQNRGRVDKEDIRSLGLSYQEASTELDLIKDYLTHNHTYNVAIRDYIHKIRQLCELYVLLNGLLKLDDVNNCLLIKYLSEPVAIKLILIPELLFSHRTTAMVQFMTHFDEFLTEVKIFLLMLDLSEPLFCGTTKFSDLLTLVDFNTKGSSCAQLLRCTHAASLADTAPIYNTRTTTKDKANERQVARRPLSTPSESSSDLISNGTTSTTDVKVIVQSSEESTPRQPGDTTEEDLPRQSTSNETASSHQLKSSSMSAQDSSDDDPETPLLSIYDLRSHSSSTKEQLPTADVRKIQQDELRLTRKRSGSLINKKMRKRKLM